MCQVKMVQNTLKNETTLVVFIFLQYPNNITMPKGYTGTGNKSDLNNHSNQGNPNNSRYQGYSSSYGGSRDSSNINNHANQSNPNNTAYNSSRGGTGSGNSSSAKKNWTWKKAATKGQLIKADKFCYGT